MAGRSARAALSFQGLQTVGPLGLSVCHTALLYNMTSRRHGAKGASWEGRQRHLRSTTMDSRGKPSQASTNARFTPTFLPLPHRESRPSTFPSSCVTSCAGSCVMKSGGTRGRLCLFRTGAWIGSGTVFRRGACRHPSARLPAVADRRPHRRWDRGRC